MTTSSEISKILLKTNAVSLNLAKPFRYASGILSPIYCDNRKLISFVSERGFILNEFVKKIHEMDMNFDVIAGTATAGIPWAAWLANLFNKPLVYVRSSQKEHGQGQLIEGAFEKNQTVVLIEDLISTGGSAISAIKSLQNEGLQVKLCAAIFSYEFQKAKEVFAEKNVPYFSLGVFSDLVKFAEKNDVLSSEEKNMILKWNENPEAWEEEWNKNAN